MEADTLPVSIARQYFKEMLAQEYLGSTDLDVLKVWAVFKSFARVRFACADDDFLFECGIQPDEQDIFYLNFTRQFLIEEDGDYDHMEQVTCQFTYSTYRRNSQLENLHAGLWSMGFATVDAYFAHVEELPEFTIPTTMYQPVRFDIFQDAV